MRQPVSPEKIREFLETLGKRAKFPCRIYLVGGTSLVFFGLREQSVDIDVALDVDNLHHQKLITLIRDLKEEMQINIEEANPGDFIPLPAGWQERSPYIGRFGKIDVYHFDLYSTALSKIERGTEIDFDDVKILLKEKKIEWKMLQDFYKEILPHYGQKSLRQDPARMQQNFKILESLI